ncbi:MAG: PIG-L deacetylase family protein [Candidatus Hadarchaeales archaeon]
MPIIPESVLVIGAHPDDPELIAGGTIAKLSKLGTEVTTGILSNGELGGRPGQRRREVERAAKILGIRKVLFGGLPDGKIQHDVDTVHLIEEWLRKVEPDIVVTHLPWDSHQDHKATGHSTISAARRHNRILFGETPSSIIKPSIGCIYVDISQELRLKLRALKIHRSQLSGPRANLCDYVEKTAAYRGLAVGVKYAEVFWASKFLLRI